MTRLKACKYTKSLLRVDLKLDKTYSIIKDVEINSWILLCIHALGTCMREFASWSDQVCLNNSAGRHYYTNCEINEFRETLLIELNMCSLYRIHKRIIKTVNWLFKKHSHSYTIRSLKLFVIPLLLRISSKSSNAQLNSLDV